MVYPKVIGPLLTPSDVLACEMPAVAKLVLLFLLMNEPKVYERQEIADELGMKPAEVEIGLVTLQRRHAHLVSRVGPNNEVLRGRHGFIPHDHPARLAMARHEEPPYAPPHEEESPSAEKVLDVFAELARAHGVAVAPMDDDTPLGGAFGTTAPIILGVVDFPIHEPDTHEKPQDKKTGRFTKKPKDNA